MLALVISGSMFISCESTELDLTQDPNFLAPEQADPDFFLNAIQEDFARLVNSIGTSTAQVTRILAFTSRNYQNAFDPAGFDNEWREAYQQILLDIRLMNVLAEERELYTHIAIGQIIEAYVMVMLVDFWGDVPYSEALLAEEGNFTPALDAGSSIYDAALVLCDNAIANLALTAAAPGDDLYFPTGDNSNWVRVANVMKMKIHLNRRLVDNNAVASFFDIVDNDDIITNASEDFEFQWGTSQTNPDTRHPLYINHYSPSGVVAGYNSNWLMDYMLNSKTGNGNLTFEGADPRMLFYYYRQASVVPVDEQLIRCTVEPIPPHYTTWAATIPWGGVYCRLDDGYWGRDHGDDSGTPPDTQSRTAYGVYPVGGLYDQSTFAVINNVEEGGNGAGITPILLSSGVDFMIAEMEMVRGNDAAARDAMLSGIQKSFTKVRPFKDLDPSAAAVAAPSTDEDTDYIAEVSNLWDAGSNDEKWNLMASELFVVLYGNGIEAYNYYRRTGYPDNIQPNLEPDPGSFIRSFIYPANAANRNPNFTQDKDVSTQVFWDTNPAGFIY